MWVNIIIFTMLIAVCCWLAAFGVDLSQDGKRSNKQLLVLAAKFFIVLVLGAIACWIIETTSSCA